MKQFARTSFNRSYFACFPPSYSGMDAMTKRQVWRAIRRTVTSGRSVILTSHSMEECEELCTRLAIMAAGEFRCLGTTNHIKTK